MTVISLGDRHLVTEDWLVELIDSYRLVDDVFHDHFLQSLVLTGVLALQVELTPAAKGLLKSWGTKWIELLDSANTSVAPPPGVYLASDGVLLEAWRLYDDTQGAFIAALGPQSNRYVRK